MPRVFTHAAPSPGPSAIPASPCTAASAARPARRACYLHPIVAAKGHARPQALDPTPALTNAALFARDQHLCLYCGHEYPRPHLTRDHVMPLSKGGRDIWENVVSACFHCNSRKGGRTPQQAGMPLLAGLRRTRSHPYRRPEHSWASTRCDPSTGAGLVVRRPVRTLESMVPPGVHPGPRAGRGTARGGDVG